MMFLCGVLYWMWKVTLTSFIVGGICVRFFLTHVTVSFVSSQTQTRGHFTVWPAGTEVIRNRIRRATISLMVLTSSNWKDTKETDYYLHLNIMERSEIYWQDGAKFLAVHIYIKTVYFLNRCSRPILSCVSKSIYMYMKIIKSYIK